MTTLELALDKVLEMDETLGQNKEGLASHQQLKQQLMDYPRFVAWQQEYALYLCAQLVAALRVQDHVEVATILLAAIGASLEMGIHVGIEMEKQELPSAKL